MSREEREARLEKKNHKLRARADLDRRSGEAEGKIRAGRNGELEQISRAQDVDHEVASEGGEPNEWLAKASKYESMTRVAVILRFGDPRKWNYKRAGREVYGG